MSSTGLCLENAGNHVGIRLEKVGKSLSASVKADAATDTAEPCELQSKNSTNNLRRRYPDTYLALIDSHIRVL